MPDLVAVLPLIGIALLFWLLIVRPASRRQQALRSLQGSLSVGDQVLLAAGLYGVIRGFDEDKIELEVAPGVVIAAARGAIVEIVQSADAHEGLEGPDLTKRPDVEGGE